MINIWSSHRLLIIRSNLQTLSIDPAFFDQRVHISLPIMLHRAAGIRFVRSCYVNHRVISWNMLTLGLSASPTLGRAMTLMVHPYSVLFQVVDLFNKI